jgi:sugar diacid utilization regulator
MAVADRALESPRTQGAGTLRPARAYRPCLFTWLGGEPTEALIARMREAALGWCRRSLLVSVDDRTQLWLLAEDSPGGFSRDRLREAVHSVVGAVRAVRPGTEIRAVVGDPITSGERLPAVAGQLRRLAGQARKRGGADVAWARRYSLAFLVESLDPRHASAFVEGQLASLWAYDHDHGTNLQRVLELALDHDNRNTAARAAFMHRNTFRRQLGKALELIDADLDCPEERLALHVALKMRRARRLGRSP